MGEGMKSISYLVFQFPEFSMLRPLVHEAVSLISSQFLLTCDRLSGDCTCGKLKQRSPNYGNHHDCVGSHAQSKLQVRCSKHIAHHHVQRVRDAKVELRGDKEFEQT
jgi:hypothetical protein